MAGNILKVVSRMGVDVRGDSKLHWTPISLVAAGILTLIPMSTSEFHVQ